MERGRPNSTQTSGVRCDCTYLKTPSGILKIIQVLSSLISFICTLNYEILNHPFTNGWFRTVTVTGFIVSLLLLIFYVIHLLEKFDSLRCLLADMVICILWAIFNLSVFWRNASVQVIAAVTATSVFTFISMVAYACDAVLKLIRIIRKQPVQD